MDPAATRTAPAKSRTIRAAYRAFGSGNVSRDRERRSARRRRRRARRFHSLHFREPVRGDFARGANRIAAGSERKLPIAGFGLVLGIDEVFVAVLFGCQLRI